MLWKEVVLIYILLYLNYYNVENIQDTNIKDLHSTLFKLLHICKPSNNQISIIYILLYLNYYPEHIDCRPQHFPIYILLYLNYYQIRQTLSPISVNIYILLYLNYYSTPLLPSATVPRGLFSVYALYFILFFSFFQPLLF